MNIDIIVVGKLKEKYFKDACDEYLKRLSKYHKIIVSEVKDEKAPEKLSEKEEVLLKEAEGKKILSKLTPSTFVIVLDINGKSIDSLQLSKKIEEIALSGKSHLTFIIGGSLGLSKEVLLKSDYKLSFSKMTFPHQLMRVILLEQIYRATKIKQNEPYHK